MNQSKRPGKREEAWGATGRAALSLSLTLVLALALGPGLGYGQEVESQDTLPPAPISASRAEQDQGSEADLQALLQRIPGLEGVGLQVEAGVAILTGNVLSLEDRALADSLVRAAEGIVFVDNRIREETSLDSRLGPVADRFQQKFLMGLAYLPLLLLAGLVVVAFLLLGGVLARWEAPYRRVTESPFMRALLQQFVGVLVGLVGVLLALELLDATALVGAVLGAAGVIGVAVGFAFRNIAENYLAGILLSLRQPFSPDDHIRVEGQEGKVIRLTSRDTILMTLDGNHVRIPNATVFNSIILNFSGNPLRRFQFDLSVGQDQDLIMAQEVGVEAYRDLQGILDDPSPRALIVEVGDSWVLLRFFGWTNQNRTGFDKVRSEAIRLAMDGLNRAGIQMPAPEYGLRFLTGAVPVPGPSSETERVSGYPSPSRELDSRVEEGPSSPEPVAPVDLSPDNELDTQIAADREAAMEDDLFRRPGE